MISLLQNQIACSRRNILIRATSRLCKEFLKGYENAHNPNIEKNGEKYVLKTIAKSGRDLNCILDVGANEGQWASVASSFFPSAIIHSFEIIPEVAELMQKNFANNKNIIVNPNGLADVNELVEVKYSPKTTVVTTLVTNRESLGNPLTKEFEIRKIKVLTGDSYVKNNNIDKIDFLKIDVEGAENRVLLGFQETLKNEKIDVIQFEYTYRVNLLTKFLLKDFYDLLKPFGFSLGRIYPNYVNFKDYIFTDEGAGFGNYLAIHNKNKDLIKLLSS